MVEKRTRIAKIHLKKQAGEEINTFDKIILS